MATRDRDSQDSASLHDEKASLLTELHHGPTTPRPRGSRKWSLVYVVLTMIAINILSILVTVKMSYARLEITHSPDLIANRRAFPGLDRSYSLVDFSEHVVNKTSRYTAPPSPAVDRAWVDLGVRDAGFILPANIGKQVGLDMREHLYHAPGTFDDPKEEGFFVLIQGFHDLHCLNELRKALYFNKAYYRQYEDDEIVPEYFRQSHVNHCLDNVRERLMCTADIGLIPSVYTGPHTETITFANKHKCRSYDRLLEWKQQWEKGHAAFERATNRPEHLPVQPPPDAVFHDPKTLS